MNRSSFASVLLISMAFWSGCGDDRPPGTAGNDSSLVGGPCMENLDCDQRLCQTGPQFPEGVCTISCGDSGQCPQGSSCAELAAGWLCLVDCQSTVDCRTDYACESQTEAGTNGGATVLVCIGPDPTS